MTENISSPARTRADLAESTSSVSDGRRFLGHFIYFSLLATIALTAVPYGAVQPWWISAFECVVFSLGVLAAIDIWISKSWHVDVSLILPLLALILFAVIQSLPLLRGTGSLSPTNSISADPDGTRMFAIEVSALVVMLVLLLHYSADRARLRSLVLVIVGVGVISAAFGLIRQKFQHTNGFILPALPMSERSFGQFINRNHFALLLEMSLGATLGLIVANSRRYVVLVICVLIAALLYVAIIYSNSRGAIIASVCEVLFLGIVLNPARSFTASLDETKWRSVHKIAASLLMRAFLGLFLIVLLMYGVGWIGGEPVVSNFQFAASDFTEQEMQNNANTSRKEIWRGTWRMIKANPFVGVGFGGYWIGITKYHQASGEFTPQQAHNDYLELMSSGGLVACALFVWFIAVFLTRAVRRARAPDAYARAACLGALAGIFGVAIHSFVDFGVHIPVNAVMLFSLFAIAAQSDPLGAGPRNNG